MKIRYGLVFSVALAVGVVGCAAGTAASGGARTAGVAGGKTLLPGQSPREDAHTSTSERLMEQASKLSKDKDTTQAKSFYNQALAAAQAGIAADSTNPLARLDAGKAAIGAGNYVEAAKQLDMAQKLRPLYQLQIPRMREKAWYDLYQKAAPLVSAGKYKEAIPIFEDANAIYRERPEVMLVLGQLYGQEHQDKRALANLDSALLIIKDSTKLANVDSATAADWKNRGQAIELTRAEVLADAGQYEKAVDAFRSLAQEHPDKIAYKRDLASLLVQTGKNAEAKQVYSQLLADSTLTAADLYQIGAGFYNMNDYKGAVKAFSGAANKRPKDRDALEMWTRCLSSDSAFAQVPAVAQRWIALDPNSRVAYILEAQALNAQGNGKQAQALVDQIQSLKVSVDQLNIERNPNGGAMINGQMTNRSLAAGATVSITFTFYDGSGNSVGTQAQQVTLDAQGKAVPFTVDFKSNAKVGGYGYTLTTS